MQMTTFRFRSIGLRFLTAAMLLAPVGRLAGAGEDGWTPLGPEDDFAAWRKPIGDWYAAGDAMVDPHDGRRLVGKPGAGVMINGKTGRTQSLVTRRHDFRDVELHVEFMTAHGSNSGVIIHGNYEIQILDSYGVKQPTAGDCGGIYPRAEAKPTYHHIDKGGAPRVNAAKPAGQWQTLDIIFQAARFDSRGHKTANARFVKVVLNGRVIHENREAPYPSGMNWRRKEYPAGPIVLQGDYGPIAYRNVRVRPWQPHPQKLNVPPPGFTTLFNGKDFAGWRLSPLAKKAWFIEDGALKTNLPLDRWGADLATEKKYRDFVFLFDFRMPEISDSGINFRSLIPKMANFGQAEQFNLRSRGGMGHLESFEFAPPEVKARLKKDQYPQVKYIDPEIGVWHTVKLTVVGTTVSAEYDGEVILDRFEYPEGILGTEAAAIRLQKHIRTEIAGKMRDCPIQYRNLFIKEIGPNSVEPVQEQSWRPLAPMLQERFEHAAALVGDTLYIFGGYGKGVKSSNQVRAFDLAKNQWRPLHDMPSAITHANTAVDGRFVWIAGGFKDGYPGKAIDEVWKYDVDKNTFAAAASLPEPRAGGGLARVGRRLHYFGGLKKDRDTDSADHWVLDLDAGAAAKWNSAAAMPAPRNQFATVTRQGRIYAIGGQFHHDSTSGKPALDQTRVDIYDPVTDSWSPGPAMPRPHSHAENSTFVHDGRIYVIGGRSVNRVEAAILALSAAGKWSRLGKLPRPLIGPAARIIDGHLVVAGGAVRGFDPQAEVWTRSLSQ